MKSTISIQKTITFLVVSFLFLASCATSYEENIRKELKIPYVYSPPNNADHPYTLFQYTKNGNFQPVCSASLLTGLTEQEIIERRKEHKTTSVEIKKIYKTEFDVKLSKKELGVLATKYQGISKVEVSFDNGKVIRISDVNLSDVVNRIKTTKCALDVNIFNTEMPNSKFFMPLEVYSYDLKYHIYTDKGVDVTADLPSDITQLVMMKLGLQYGSTSSVNVAGDNMYIGFRGTPINASLKSPQMIAKRMTTLEEFNSALMKVRAMADDVQVLDMTDIVRSVIDVR